MDPLPAQAAFDAASFAHLFIQHPDMKHPLGASEQGGRAELINEIQVRNSRADGSDHCGSTPQVSIETEHRRGVKEGNKTLLEDDWEGLHRGGTFDLDLQG